MKRFSKVIALALLLAVVVSAFGIFSAFAEEVVDTGISVFYDSNGETAWSSSVTGNNNASAKYPLLTKADGTKSNYSVSYKATLPSFLDANNNRYYRYGYNVAFPAKDIEAGGKVTLGNPWFSPTKIDPILLSDSSKGKKNTDFIVLDFDIDPSHLYTGYFQPQLRFQTAGGTSKQGTHLRVYGGDAEGGYEIGLSTGTKFPLPTANDSNWINLTVIIDARDASVDSTGYLYANGMYVGSYTAFKAGAEQLTDARICLETNGVEIYGNNATGHTADIANFTIKGFKNGYSGPLAQDFDKVGKSIYTLDNFSDLAYWDDNQISDYIATVDHEDGSTDYLTTIDNFGSVVKEGDKVTLNGHIFRTLYIPGKTEVVNEVEVVTPLITFDTNGYYMAEPVAVDTEKYDWVIEYTSGTVEYGSQDGLLISADFNEDGFKDGDFNFDGKINTYYVKADEAASFKYQTFDEFTALGLTTSATKDDVYTTKITEANRYTVKDPLFTAIAANSSATITLLNDITMYGPGSKGVESSATDVKSLRYKHYFNLNGKTLTVDARVNHLFGCTGAYKNNVVFKNGTIIFDSPSTNNLLYWDNSSNTEDEINYYGTATFDNLTKLEVNGILSDQRIGVIKFINCDDIVTNSTLVSEKSGRNKWSRVLLYGSTITANASPFSIANISAGGTYNGSHDNELNITKSTITAEGCTPIQLLARNEGGTSAAGLLNNNKTTILISDSTITADGGSFFYDTPSFGTINANTNPSETVFTTNVNVSLLNNSTISVTGYLFDRSFENGVANTKYESAIAQYKGVDYNFNLFVDSGSKAASGLTFFDCYYNNEEYEVDFTITAEAGALLGYPKLTNDSDEVVITLPSDNELAFTSTNEGYNHIVTSNYTTNTYTKGTAVVDEEFYWNSAENEEIKIEWVTDLAETAAYKYTWATSAIENGTAYTATLAPNFTPSVSMSTDGTLALNLFLPAEVYEALGGENVTFTSELGYEIEKALNADLGQYGKEGSFVQAKVKGIDPSKANETAVTVTFNIIGAYGDSDIKTLNISVVSYAKMVIKNGTSAAEKQYAVQLLNYVKAVMDYAGKNTTAIDDIITESGLTVKAGNVGEAAAGGTVTGIDKFAMNLGGSINWVLTVSGNDTYTVSYTRDGKTVTAERTAENGEIVISLRAYDALGTVTVKNNKDNTSSTFNIANYYAAQDEDAKAVLTALAAYAETAVAYKAQLDKAN